jgi:hypothetical protein
MPQLRESLRNDLVPSPLPPLPTLWAPPLAPRGLPLLPLSLAPPLLGASIGPPRAAADDEATVATATTEAGGPAESATSGEGEGVRW